jgi:hypothetical protein
MQRTTVILTLRILWVVLMLILGVLIVTGSIGGFATSIFAAAILAVFIAELAVKRKVHQH